MINYFLFLHIPPPLLLVSKRLRKRGDLDFLLKPIE
ncbi:unnamed protein product, partial [Onchocerca ochengi]|uniref:Uncharacterized protein n=1 Tax=Onchocerca ochengi TaxID=42157 RepID=A0A182F090_ONCOC